MKQYNSPKEMHREEIRQDLWNYLQDNPMTIYQLWKATNLSQNVIEDFLDPSSKRVFGLNVMLEINKFLRNKYKERDAKEEQKE